MEIVNHLRAGSTGVVRSPSAFPPTYIHPSPNVHADSPASMSTPVSARPTLDTGHPVIMSTPQPGSTVRPVAPPAGLVLLTLLSRCTLVLPYPPCGPTVMDKHHRCRKEVRHTNRSTLNITSLLACILRCHHYLAWSMRVLLALHLIIFLQ